MFVDCMLLQEQPNTDLGSINPICYHLEYGLLF